MNKNTLRGFAVSGLLVMGLAACGGSGSSTDAGPAPANETSTPTPTAAKQYTSAELTDLVKQIKPADGSELTVTAIDDLAAQANPLKELMGSMNIEPAECKDLAMSGASQSIEGSTGATGAKVDTATGSVSSVALVSGVPAETLQKSLEGSESQITTCSSMKMTMGGTALSMKTEKLDGVGSVPGTVGLKTTMTLPGGQAQSTVMAFAVKGGVLISATASGQNGGTDGAAEAGTLMDQAAALVK
ncbi:hypothetical protein MOD31_03835 [Paenarthrobacter sp. TYUT067]|uniref:hypothetical protein n=1 Tax=Paenarthrobacter sp. TYUT067 TaxID=2926245 RepID=UPI002030E5A7|nr:hypothetical protein [Paenarthrobacter sp. TYUT067]MCM0615140.1 hypothetical protein [Paenarthrobacter sp. TYUT067]